MLGPVKTNIYPHYIQMCSTWMPSSVKKKNFPWRIRSLYFQLIAESNNEMQQ